MNRTVWSTGRFGHKLRRMMLNSQQKKNYIFLVIKDVITLISLFRWCFKLLLKIHCIDKIDRFKLYFQAVCIIFSKDSLKEETFNTEEFFKDAKSMYFEVVRNLIQYGTASRQ